MILHILINCYSYNSEPQPNAEHSQKPFYCVVITIDVLSNYFSLTRGIWQVADELIKCFSIFFLKINGLVVVFFLKVSFNQSNDTYSFFNENNQSHVYKSSSPEFCLPRFRRNSRILISCDCKWDLRRLGSLNMRSQRSSCNLFLAFWSTERKVFSLDWWKILKQFS